MVRVNLSPNPALGVNATNWGGGTGGVRSTGVTGLPRPFGYTYTGTTDVYTPRSSVSANTQYTVSLYVKAAFTGTLTYNVNFYSAGAYHSSATQGTLAVTSGTVYRITRTFTTPSTVNELLMVNSGGACTTGCSLVETGAVLDTYFDGSFAGATWSGTAENSTSTLTGVQYVETGGAAARVAGSGAKLRTRQYTDTGGAAARGAGSGSKIVESAIRARSVASAMSIVSTVVVVKKVTRAVSSSMTTTSSRATIKGVSRTVTSVLMASGSVALQIFGRDEAPPYLEIVTSPYVPLPRKSLRVIAQRIVTGQFLDWDVPLTDLEIIYTLSGATMIRGDLGPESQDIRDIGLDPWGTWLHVEENDEIRGSGILLPLEIPGEILSLEAAGVTYYPNDMPWKGYLSEVQIDPAEVVRRIWAHLQSYPESKLNAIVSNTQTPVRLGDMAYVESTMDAQGVVTTRDVPAKPYELNWWEAPDCGAEIASLAKSTPFDFVERSQWNPTKTGVDNYIDIGYPRIGRRLVGSSAPRFVQGENATQMFVLGETPDLYASEVIVLGKGEGSAMIRGEVGLRNTGRLRRVAVLTDPAGIGTTSRAVALAREELARRSALLTIGDVVIDSTNPLAPMGSYRVGDDILVQADVPYHGEVSLWHRIIGYTWKPGSERVSVQLRRSEQFNYGTEV